jgi:hypothetical protein
MVPAVLPGFGEAGEFAMHHGAEHVGDAMHGARHAFGKRIDLVEGELDRVHQDAEDRDDVLDRFDHGAEGDR